MKNIIKLLLCIITIYQANAQVSVLDSISKKPVPFVEIYLEDGSLLGTTNQVGEISQELMVKSNLQQIYLHHSNYHNKKCFVDYNNEKTLLLIPIYLSQEVPKKHSCLNENIETTIFYYLYKKQLLLK